VGLRGLLACLEGARERAVDERVLEEVLGELAERVLTLAGEALAQPFGGGGVRHGGKATHRAQIPRSLTLD
jgi:hypothetical protein